MQWFSFKMTVYVSRRKFYLVLRVFSSFHKASWSKYNCPRAASVQRPAWETKLAVTSVENRATGPKIADVVRTVAMAEAWGDSLAVEVPQGAARATAWVALEVFLIEVTQWQGHFPLPHPWAGAPATANTAQTLENDTPAGHRAPIRRDRPRTSENATEALTITRSIGLVRLALASSRIGLSLFPLLLPLPLLPLSQGCGWLLPVSIPMSDALWRLRLPQHQRTSRGTVAQSDVWVPVQKATRTSARDFPRSQGAHRLTLCRGPGRTTPSGFDTHTKPHTCLRWANAGR